MRPVGEAYQQLIKSWATVLPTQSVVLALPIAPTRGAGTLRPYADGTEGEAEQIPEAVETSA